MQTDPHHQKVSVVILNWNGLRFLGSCITSLGEQTYPEYEIIMVDNGSTDGSVEFVKSNFPSVKTVENRVNLGFAAGNDIGIRYSSGDYVILLNTDTRVSPNFVEELVNCACVDPKIGSVGCRLLPENGSVKHGPMFTNNGYIVPLLAGGILLKDKLEMLFKTDGYCLANCAAAALYRKSALEVTEGFDPDFQFDWEDNDLGFRLLSAGYKNYYTTKTNVVHIGGASLGSIFSKDRYIRIMRNMLFTYIKNYEPRNVVTRFLFLLLILVPFHHIAKILLNELRSFCDNSPQQATRLPRQAYFSLFEAYLQFIRGLRHATRQRAKVQASRKVSDSSIFLLTKRSGII